ncbi:GNAT family N-acetyltransferase [Rhizobium straminoryzae]|uniref:GNAT family N-acetyltransferase n=1 Tax=Rhizobium straminoryzae TaxID=1387186 RepID=A0A549TIV9_9HYPH|nr:GNAT family N-acetyltransferase [Rhizobium straminoryzae]TRL43481.1 GNAT family N-acetyltransferase [Rhizobium straminoryzae]
MPTIRNAREDEAELLSEIGLRAWEDAMGEIGVSPELRENAQAAFRGFTYGAWLTITVVEEAGTVAGWAAREGLDELISDFWIDPAFKRRGLGTALLREIEEQIAAHGHPVARLETHARNVEALRFFEGKGYGVNWLSVVYSPKLDQDVQSVGLSKQLVEEDEAPFGYDV